jgi:hypothetical protein
MRQSMVFLSKVARWVRVLRAGGGAAARAGGAAWPRRSQETGARPGIGRIAAAHHRSSTSRHFTRMPKRI